MPWNTVCPLGSVSVKANRTIIQQNMTYIETTLGNSIVGTNTVTTRDHFFNVGTNEDGRHRFINSPAFTVGGIPTDPVLGSGMDSVLYAKTTSARSEWFHRNAAGIYQFIPSFLSGTIVITTSFQNMVTVPASVYGDICMFRANNDGSNTIQTGFFKSSATGLGVAAIRYINADGDGFVPLRFDRSGFIIRVRTNDAPSGDTWNYRVTYRAV